MFDYENFFIKSNELMYKKDNNGQRVYTETQVALKMGTTIYGFREIRRKAIWNRWSRIRESFKSGKTVQEIANEFGLRESSVRAFLKAV